MKIIDLTQPLFSGMPVYPGDPEVKIEQVHTLEKQGWNLRTLFLNTHLGTHVNAPAHMMNNGKTLDDFPLEVFCGKAVVYQDDSDINPSLGVIFSSVNIDKRLAELIIKKKPRFVGLAAEQEFDIEIEKKLLQAGIISYENLVNTEKLPIGKQFMFYGFPLKIKGGDGSPVRAAAVI